VKTDAELSASQLRSRYEVVNREHNRSADFGGGPGGLGHGVGSGSELQHPGWGPDAAMKWSGAEPPFLRAREGSMSSDSSDPSGKNKGGRRGSATGLRLSRLSDCCDTSEPATPPIGTSFEHSFFPPHPQYHGSSSTYSDSVSGGSSPNSSVHGLPASSSVHGRFVGGPDSVLALNSFDGGLNSLSGLSSSSSHGVVGNKSEFTAEVAQAAGVNLEGYVARSVKFTLARERRQRRKKWLKWAGGIGACVAFMILVAIVFESGEGSSGSGNSGSSRSNSHNGSGSMIGGRHSFFSHGMGGRLLLSITSFFSRPSAAAAVVEDPFSERPSASAALAHPEAQAPPPIRHTSARAAMAAAGSASGVPLVPPLAGSAEEEEGNNEAWTGGWRRPCGQTWCVGDRVRLDANALLDDAESPWAAVGVNAMSHSNSSSSSGSASSDGGAGTKFPPATCTARVLLVQEKDSSSNDGARGAASEAAGGDEVAEEGVRSSGSKRTTKRLPRMVLVLPDGWAGQAAFWLQENDHALLSAKSRPLHGGAAAAAYTPQPPGLAANSINDADALPCPYSFATLGDGGWDAVSDGGGAACSVAMRDYCELSAPEPPPVWALPSSGPSPSSSGSGSGGSRLAPQKRKSSSGPPQQVKSHKRRATSCTTVTHSHGLLEGSAAAAIAASRSNGGGVLSGQGGGLRGGPRDVDSSSSRSSSGGGSNGWGSNWQGVDRRVLGTPPAAWLAAQQDAHALDARCPPPAVLAWPPDRWSFPDCSRGMRAKLTSLLLQADNPLSSEGGGGDEGSSGASSGSSGSSDSRSSGAAAQRLWWLAQTELAEEGTCPRPELALWPPDAQTHPRCNSCVTDACGDSANRASSSSARASARAAAAERQPSLLSADALSGSGLLVKANHAWAAANPTGTASSGGAAGAVVGGNLTASSGIGERVRTATKWQPVASSISTASSSDGGSSNRGGASIDAEEASVAASCGNRAQLEAAWQMLGPSGRVGDTAAPEVVAAAAAPITRHRRVLLDLAAAQQSCAAPASARGGGGRGNWPLLPPNPASLLPGSTGGSSSGGDSSGGADSLWAAGGLLDGACPAPHILRWLPPPELAFPDCALALGHHCAAFAVEDQALSGRHARHAPLTAADCAVGKWLSSNDVGLAQRAQVAASEEGLCPAGSAASARSGVSGVLWATHDRPPHRSALSSRVCELPLV